MSRQLDDEIRARDDVLSRTLDGEAVLLDLRTGTYFGLNPVGTAAWSLIKDGATLERIVTAIIDQFDVDYDTAKRDLLELVDILEKRDLLARRGGGADP